MAESNADRPKTPEEVEARMVRGFQRVLATDRSLIETYVRKGTPDGLEGDARLLAWDANSVKEFVFGTTNAAGIRGASERLKKKIDHRFQKAGGLPIDKGQILFAGGGRGLAVLTPQQVESVSRGIHERFSKQTSIATANICHIPLLQGEQTFAERLSAIESAMARQRVELAPNAQPNVHFWEERCQVCGRRAAAENPTRLTGARLECAACVISIEKGKRKEKDEEEDFKHIADRADHLAVLYMDGNRIGKLFAELTSPLEYGCFSWCVAEVLEDTFESLAESYGLKDDRETVDEAPEDVRAYQLPISGGDDLIAIIPADISVPFGRDLLEKFAANLEAHPLLPHRLRDRFEASPPEDRVGASVGIGIANYKYPIRHLLAEAEALLKSAKKRVYQDGVRCALDFAVVKDGAPRIEATARQRLQSGKATDFLLSGRPYSLHEMRIFSRRFNIIRQAQLGRSQLYALERVAGRGQHQLGNHVLYQIAREEGWRKLVRELADEDLAALSFEERKARHLGQVMVPYADEKRGSRQAVFDIGDMLELYRFWDDSVPSREANP